MNNQRKQIIELFGNHWHEKEEEKERIDHFSEYGYKTLIIWENELNNPILKHKINSWLE